MTERVKHLDCAANDLEDFAFEQQQLVPIRVHSCRFVVRT
jgi:hypothetical protein